ncbi:MAG: SDR family NAD(P)-dependent oxidoreductase [Spirochaetia bacterium]
MSGIKEGERNTALVTGSGRGIGRGIAAALAERGWTVAVHYRANRDTAEETLEELRRRGGDGFTVSADISDLDQHEALVEKVLEKRGGIDLFVNNAGIAPRTP